MSWTRFTAILIAVVIAVPLARAHAQAGTVAARDPADPKVTVPPVRYDSAFARYRPSADVDVGPWRDANDNVGRIGGWRAYGREAIADPKVDRAPTGGANSTGSPAKPEHGHAHRGVR